MAMTSLTACAIRAAASLPSRHAPDCFITPPYLRWTMPATPTQAMWTPGAEPVPEVPRDRFNVCPLTRLQPVGGAPAEWASRAVFGHGPLPAAGRLNRFVPIRSV